MSRGSGYVTMSSMREAKAAIAALDGSVSSPHFLCSFGC